MAMAKTPWVFQFTSLGFIRESPSPQPYQLSSNKLPCAHGPAGLCRLSYHACSLCGNSSPRGQLLSQVGYKLISLPSLHPRLWHGSPRSPQMKGLL